MPIKEHVCPHCNFYGTDSETLLVCPDCGCSDVTNVDMASTEQNAERIDYEETELDGEVYGDEETELDGEVYGDEEFFQETNLDEEIGDLDL